MSFYFPILKTLDILALNFRSHTLIFIVFSVLNSSASEGIFLGKKKKKRWQVGLPVYQNMAAKGRGFRKVYFKIKNLGKLEF